MKAQAQGSPASSTGSRGLPAWTAPVVILVVIVGLIAVGRKREEAVENPLVDLAIITVGVFAFAAAFRFLAVKMNAPGLAAFFGGSPHTDPNPPSAY